MLTKTTTTIKPKDISRNWYLIDAKGKTLGRLSTKVALLLTGKGKPVYSPNRDCGDYVVVINAKEIAVTGQKIAQKVYYKHSGYLGGLKEITLEKLLIKDPTMVIKKSVTGMVPRNRLGRDIIKKLKVFPGAEHAHEAQNPVKIDA